MCLLLYSLMLSPQTLPSSLFLLKSYASCAILTNGPSFSVSVSAFLSPLCWDPVIRTKLVLHVSSGEREKNLSFCHGCILSYWSCLPAFMTWWWLSVIKTNINLIHLGASKQQKNECRNFEVKISTLQRKQRLDRKPSNDADLRSKIVNKTLLWSDGGDL